MMNLKGALLCVCCVLGAGMLAAQDQAMLIHAKRDKQVSIQVGTPVRLEVSRTPGLVLGEVWGASVKDSVLWILPDPLRYDPNPGGDTYPQPIAIPLYQIEDWYIQRRLTDNHWQEVYNQASLLVGGGIIGGTSTQTIATGRAPHISSILAATAILTSGLLVKYIPPKWYRAHKGWRLQIIPGPDSHQLSGK